MEHLWELAFPVQNAPQASWECAICAGADGWHCIAGQPVSEDPCKWKAGSVSCSCAKGEGGSWEETVRVAAPGHSPVPVPA